MAYWSLEEINHNSITGSPANEHAMKYKPITPLVIEVELPRSRKSSRAMKHKPEVLKIYEKKPQQKSLKKKRGLFTAISDMLFSLAVIMILFIVLVPGSNDGTPKTIFNYSYFTVVSPSMQDEIPQGSFILVKNIDPLALTTGDNITYMADRSTSVTHKIVGIYENYDNSGTRGFQTQGVNNPNPDSEIVYEANIVGKVIFVLPAAGVVLSYLNENVFLIFILFGLCVLFSFFLRGVFAKSAKRKQPKIN